MTKELRELTDAAEELLREARRISIDPSLMRLALDGEIERRVELALYDAEAVLRATS